MKYRLASLLVCALLLLIWSSAFSENETKEKPTAVLEQTPATGDLTEEETAGLLYMREEEKLAYDVYVTLYRKWKLPIFNNIAWSETRHMERIAMLLQTYGLTDPAAGKLLGEYQAPALKKLYDELVASGKTSLVSALQVGAEIEELDIADLTAQLAQTNKRDLTNVYKNLRRASGNHLFAFVSQLKAQGITYQPKHLPKQEYQRIMNEESQRESRGRGYGRR